MKALVLAAGLGTRLRPLTLERPKAMLPIGDKPLIGHIVDHLRAHGVTEVAVNLHHQPDAIRSYLKDGRAFGVHMVYSYEPELMGTAGAAKRLESFLDETFVVWYGDVFTSVDLSAMARFHRAREAWATVGVQCVSNPWEKGIVETDATTGRVVRFIEKPPRGQEPGNLANAAIYIMEPEVLGYVPPERLYDFGYDIFPVLLNARASLYAYPISEYLLDIGSLEAYEQVQKDYERGLPLA